MTRVYRSRVRAEAAQNTRSAIIEAARSLFFEQGYPRTSVAAVAERAGVALNTVYTSIGGKPALILAVAAEAAEDTVIDAALASIAELTDGRDILRVTAQGTGDVTRRQARTLGVLLANRGSEPAVNAATEAAIGRYRDRLTSVAERLRAIGALRAGVDIARATDILWFHFGASSWATVQDLGWDWEEAAVWLGEQAGAALLSSPRLAC